VDHTVLTANTPHLHLPVIHVPNYMDHYSFTDPWERAANPTLHMGVARGGLWIPCET